MTLTALPLPEAVDILWRADDPTGAPSAESLPGDGPACATARHLGVPPSAWTPESEADEVPAFLARICDACPVRTACLHDAVLMNDIGYRAGTTTSERHRLFPHLAAVVPEIDESDGRRARHAPGEGSLSRYRRGCRCDECRGSNAAARRRERAKAG